MATNASQASLRHRLRALPREAWILFAGTFLNRFGSFVMVFIVAWVTRLGHPPAAAGGALASYGLGHLFASLIGGILADRLGRRVTIVISMFGSAASALALSRATDLTSIIVLGFLMGLTAELYRPASSAMLADLTPPGERLLSFTVYRLAINLGFAAGPATAGFLAERSFTLLFVGDALTSIAFALIALFALPERRTGTVASEAGGEGFLASVRSNRPFLAFLAASILTTFVFFQAESTFTLHVLDSGFSSTTYGLLISINGVLIVCFELWAISITGRFKPRSMIALGFLLVGGAFAINAVSSSISMLVAAVVLWSLGEIISAPVSSAWVADLAPAHLRGRYMGAWAFTWSIGLILGPLLGSIIYGWSPRALWMLCGLLGVASATIILRTEHSAILRPEET